MSQAQWARYQASIQSVIDYIHDNPAGPVDNDALAQIACLSTFHWHRIYRGITGETAVQTVRNVRMNIAAGDLIRTNQTITDIGRKVGYPTAQSFTRAFKTYSAKTPGQIRQSFQEPPIINTQTEIAEYSFDVSIVNQKALRLIGLHHQGDYMHVGRSFAKVFAADIVSSNREHESSDSSNNDLGENEPTGVCVYFQDPASTTDSSQLTSFAGVRGCESTNVPDGFSESYSCRSLRCVDIYRAARFA